MIMLTVCPWVEQRLMLMLTVEVDEVPRDLPQVGIRGQHTIDERPTAPVSRDVAPNRHFRAIRCLEDRLHESALLASPDQVRIGTRPRQQSNRANDDGFPRSSLTRQHVKPRTKLDLECIDDGEPMNAQIPNHGLTLDGRVIAEARATFGPRRGVLLRPAAVRTAIISYIYA